MVPDPGGRCMNRHLRFVFAAVTTFVLSCITLGIGYGAGLLAGGHIYTATALPIKLSVPFAGIVGIIAMAYPNRKDSRQHNVFIVAVTGAATGCVYWYLSERVLAMQFTGRWQWGFLSLDYELQMALCWVAAGASAMLVAVIRRPSTVLVPVVILCLLAVVLPAPIFNYLAKNQELTVALAIPVGPGTSATRPPEVIASESKEFDAEIVVLHVLSVLRS